MTDAKKRVLLIGVTGGCGGVTGEKLVAAGYEVIVTCRESHVEKIRARSSHGSTTTRGQGTKCPA